MLSRSQTTHLTIIADRAPGAPGACRLHRDVRRLEAELPVQRAHPEVPGVHLAGQLTHPGLVGRPQHRREQQLPDLAAVRDVGDGQRPEVPVPGPGQRVRSGPTARPSPPAGPAQSPRHRHQRDLPRLPQRARDPTAMQPGVGDGLVAERHLRDLDLEPGDRVEILGPGLPDQVAGRRDRGVGRRVLGSGRGGAVIAAQRHRAEHVAAALRAAGRLQGGDPRPPAARPDLVHRPAVGAPVRPGGGRAGVRGVQRSGELPVDQRFAPAVLRRWYRWLVPARMPAPR